MTPRAVIFDFNGTISDDEPVIRMTRWARSMMLIDSEEPTLKISPEIDASSIRPVSASTTSATWQKQRVWLPSPWTSSGRPARAFSTKRGMTIP